MGHVTNPGDVVYLEHARAEAARLHDLGRSVPTDVFVFGLGEPSRRDLTKVGGMPYRPAAIPWPVGVNGEPMRFVAQWRFAESKDITGDLPGDLLLFFVDNIQDLPWLHDDEKQFRFDWYNLGVTDLVTEDNVPLPDSSFKSVTCFGIRHRTVDYPEPKALSAIYDWLPADDSEKEYLGLDVARSTARIAGMKIGGVPYWPLQSDKTLVEELPGRFLCSLAAIGLATEVPYPWLNRPEPYELFTSDQALEFDWSAGLVLNFSMDDSQQIHWISQFY
jgi:hypothetical protein